MSSLFGVINSIAAWATMIIVFGCAVGLSSLFGCERPRPDLESSSLWWIE